MLHRLIYFAFPDQCASCRCSGSGLCERCAPRDAPLQRRLATLTVSGLGAYDGPYRAAVRALKDGRRDIASELGDRLASLVCESDILVPVPTTASRRRVRGVDGVELVASIAARRSGASVVTPLRCISRERQRGRSRSERLAARGRFLCASDLVAGMHVTLVDDVCTTGATLEDCAAVLRASGARVSRALVAAIATHELPRDGRSDVE